MCGTTQPDHRASSTGCHKAPARTLVPAKKIKIKIPAPACRRYDAMARFRIWPLEL